MKFMDHVQSSRAVYMKSPKESALSRIGKVVCEFPGFIGHYQLLLHHLKKYFTLYVPVTDHLKISKEFT